MTPMVVYVLFGIFIAYVVLGGIYALMVTEKLNGLIAWFKKVKEDAKDA